MKNFIRSIFTVLLVVASLSSFAQRAFTKESVVLPPGRNILMQPSLNHLGPARGKIIIDIVINNKGDVVSARANRARTTIRDRRFIHDCEQAIMEMKFNKIKHGPERQYGSLGYTFR